MSLETWKQEFLPEPYPDNEIAALEHSIRKWEGLSHDNLARHGIKASDGRLYDDEDNYMYPDSEYCALCLICHCDDCPLKDVYVDYGDNEPCHAEWGAWIGYNDSLPMLRLLHATLENERKKHAGKR